MFMFGEKWKILRMFVFLKYFYRKIIKLWNFENFNGIFFCHFWFFIQKFFFRHQKYTFVFSKKNLDLIRPLHCSKIIKVALPAQKGRFFLFFFFLWGGGAKFICHLFQKFFNMKKTKPSMSFFYKSYSIVNVLGVFYSKFTIIIVKTLFI